MTNCRTLTDQEYSAMVQKRSELQIARLLTFEETGGFRHGFIAGLEYSAESLDCLRLVQQLAGGQDWREWLERVANALIVVNNQYGNVESAMEEHPRLFGKSESEE